MTGEITLRFDPIEVDGIIRELEARGFDVGEDDRETTAAVLPLRSRRRRMRSSSSCARPGGTRC